MKRMAAILLAVMLTVTMTPLAGTAAFASDGSAAREAAADAGIDLNDADEVAAFNEAVEEAGIDLGDASGVEEEPDVKVIGPESGGMADKVPAAAVDVKKPKKAKSVSSKSVRGLDDFSAVDPETAVAIEEGTTRYSTNTAGETATYMFVAPKTCDYFFYSENNTEDTCGRVLEYNESAESIDMISDNDDGGEGTNFRITFHAVAGQTYYLQVRPYYDRMCEADICLYPDEYEASINVSLNKSTGNATVTGSVTGDTFYGLYVDGTAATYDVGGKTSFSKVIDMKKYSVGFHTISAVLTNHDDPVVYRYAVATYIYSYPSIKKSMFTTGSKYFSFSNNGKYYSKDPNCKVYLDFRKSGGKWKNNYGPVDSYGSGKKSGLKSNSWYYVRAHYGKKVSYNGKTYFFTGKDLGKKSGSVKIKTGKSKKPPVKSISITKAKQFSRSYSYTTWIYIGGFGYPTVHYYTQWYTSFKVTVKMKKKPGAAGIYIGNVRVKGNKKKYTANFTVYGKQKGKKLTVGVCSYQNATYKGYSPSYKKKVKVRK